MEEPEGAGAVAPRGASGGRRIVVLNWTLDAENLVDALRGVRDEGGEVVCIGTHSAAEVERSWASREETRSDVRYVSAPSASEDLDSLTAILREGVDIASACSVIVLPDHRSREPDANSRVTCVAVARASEGADIPNTLVEVRDPEAAYEFAGLGVATVFYPGYLRAALLAHACVDLGVFQFLYSLLRGDLRVRLLPLSDELRRGTFVEAVLAHEEDDAGAPITVIGLQLAANAETPERLVINPGPRHAMTHALGLLTLREGA